MEKYKEPNPWEVPLSQLITAVAKLFWRNVGTCDNQQCNLKEMGQTMQLFYD